MRPLIPILLLHSFNSLIEAVFLEIGGEIYVTYCCSVIKFFSLTL